MAKTGGPAAVARPGARRAGWRDGAAGLSTTGSRLATRISTLLLRQATPGSPAAGAAGGGKGLAEGSEPPRPATEGNAVVVRRTIGSGERCVPEWRRRPAGLTDAPATRSDWAPLGPAAAARSAVLTAPPALGVVPHLPVPPPRRGAEFKSLFEQNLI